MDLSYHSNSLEMLTMTFECTSLVKTKMAFKVYNKMYGAKLQPIQGDVTLHPTTCIEKEGQYWLLAGILIGQ